MPVMKVNAPPVSGLGELVEDDPRMNGSHAALRCRRKTAQPGEPSAEVSIELIASLMDGPPGSVRGT